MLGDWLEDIKTIGIFLICAQTLIHFRPKGTYVKYLRLLVSIMLLVQLMEPLGRILGFLEAGELQRRVGEMEKKLMQINGQSYFLENEAEDIWNMLLQDTEWQQEESEMSKSEMPESEEE